MTQDVVTAKDVAAPATVTLRLQDAQPICDKLDDALTKELYRRTAYSMPVQSLLQLAWAVASHKRSVQVTVYHQRWSRIFAQGVKWNFCLTAGKDSARESGEAHEEKSTPEPLTGLQS